MNVGLGYTIAKISGENHTWKNALIDVGTGFVGAGVTSKIATVSTHIGKRAVMNGAANAVLSAGGTVAHNKVGGKSLTDGIVESAVLGFGGGSLGSAAADKNP